MNWKFVQMFIQKKQNESTEEWKQKTTMLKIKYREDTKIV